MTRAILQPPGWAMPRGYVNGVVAEGRHVFVAGQIGWNERCEFASDDLVEQVRQALLNVRAVLREAGAGPEHITRMTWYLVDKREYQLLCEMSAGAGDPDGACATLFATFRTS